MEGSLVQQPLPPDLPRAALEVWLQTLSLRLHLSDRPYHVLGAAHDLSNPRNPVVID